MVDATLARQRLVAQGLIEAQCGDVTGVVSEFLAMQGQDLPGVIASVALRLPIVEVQPVLDAMNDGLIVRGYPMRGTVFLMPAEDVTWVTELCAAGPLRNYVTRRARLGLDEMMVEQAREILATALAEAPTGLPRSEVGDLWQSLPLPETSGINYHLISFFAHEAFVCWGPWNGKDQNLVLADAWLPAGRSLEERFNSDQVAATAELLRRYLLSHGPATERDFAWWSKLPLRQIRAALPTIADQLETDGESYWRPGLMDQVEALGKLVDQPLLLPAFDEFILGYPYRQFAMTAEQEQLLVPGNNGVFKRSAVAGGLVKGHWTRAGRATKRSLDLTPTATTLVREHKGWDKRFAEFPFVTD